MIHADAGVPHPKSLMENPRNSFTVNPRSEGKSQFYWGYGGYVTRERTKMGDVMRVEQTVGSVANTAHQGRRSPWGPPLFKEGFVVLPPSAAQEVRV